MTQKHWHVIKEAKPFRKQDNDGSLLSEERFLVRSKKSMESLGTDRRMVILHNGELDEFIEISLDKNTITIEISRIEPYDIYIKPKLGPADSIKDFGIQDGTIFITDK